VSKGIKTMVKGTHIGLLYKTETYPIWVNVNGSDQPLGIRKVTKLLGLIKTKEEEKWAPAHYLM